MVPVPGSVGGVGEGSVVPVPPVPAGSQAANSIENPMSKASNATVLVVLVMSPHLIQGNDITKHHFEASSSNLSIKLIVRSPSVIRVYQTVYLLFSTSQYTAP